MSERLKPATSTYYNKDNKGASSIPPGVALPLIVFLTLTAPACGRKPETEVVTPSTPPPPVVRTVTPSSPEMLTMPTGVPTPYYLPPRTTPTPADLKSCFSILPPDEQERLDTSWGAADAATLPEEKIRFWHEVIDVLLEINLTYHGNWCNQEEKLFAAFYNLAMAYEQGGNEKMAIVSLIRALCFQVSEERQQLVTQELRRLGVDPKNYTSYCPPKE